MDLGIIDARRRDQHLVRAANRCIVGLRGTGLLADRKPYGTYYACGAILLFLLDDDLGKRTAGELDLDKLLARTWARAAEGDGRYSTLALVEEAQIATDDPNRGGDVAAVALRSPAPIRSIWPSPRPCGRRGLPAALGPIAEGRLEVDDFRKATAQLLTRVRLARAPSGATTGVPSPGSPTIPAPRRAPSQTSPRSPSPTRRTPSRRRHSPLKETNAVRIGDGRVACDADRSWTQLLVLAE